MNDSATKNSNTAVFIFAVPKHTKKRTILLRMRRTLGKTPNQLDALETTALFATSFPGFFFREVRRHSGRRSRQDPYSNTRGSTHY